MTEQTLETTSSSSSSTTKDFVKDTSVSDQQESWTDTELHDPLQLIINEPIQMDSPLSEDEPDDEYSFSDSPQETKQTPTLSSKNIDLLCAAIKNKENDIWTKKLPIVNKDLLIFLFEDAEKNPALQRKILEAIVTRVESEPETVNRYFYITEKGEAFRFPLLHLLSRENGYPDLVRKILAIPGVKVNLQSTPHNPEQPTYKTSALSLTRNKEIAMLLIERGAPFSNGELETLFEYQDHKSTFARPMLETMVEKLPANGEFYQQVLMIADQKKEYFLLWLAQHSTDINVIEKFITRTSTPNLEVHDSDNMTALTIAIKNNNLPLAELLLKHGAKFDHASDWSHRHEVGIKNPLLTPLEYAFQTRNLALISLLQKYSWQRKAEQKERKESPTLTATLHSFVTESTTEASMPLTVQTTITTTPSLDQQLLDAVKAQNITLAVELLEKGANPWRTSPETKENIISYIIRLEDPDKKRAICKALVNLLTEQNVNYYFIASDEYGQFSLTLLHVLVSNGYADLIKEVLKIPGTEVNLPLMENGEPKISRDSTSHAKRIHYEPDSAIAKTHLGTEIDLRCTPSLKFANAEIATLLIQAGAKFWEEEITQLFNHENGDAPYPKALIQAMADKLPNDKLFNYHGSHSFLNWMVATSRDNNLIKQYVLDKKPNLETKDSWSNTPLGNAILNGNFDLAEFLLTQGASPNRMIYVDSNTKNISLLAYALKIGNTSLSGLLETYGAKEDVSQALEEEQAKKMEDDIQEIFKSLGEGQWEKMSLKDRKSDKTKDDADAERKSPPYLPTPPASPTFFSGASISTGTSTTFASSFVPEATMYTSSSYAQTIGTTSTSQTLSSTSQPAFFAPKTPPQTPTIAKPPATDTDENPDSDFEMVDADRSQSLT